MKRYLLFLFLAGTHVSAQHFAWNEACYKAYEEITKLNFTEARSIIEIEKKKHPANLVLPYISSQGDFIRVFISESSEDFEALKKKNEERIKQVETFHGEDPHKKLFLAEYYLQMAVARLKFEEYIGAVYETRKAFRLLQDNRKEYPAFQQNLRSLGFIHAFVGTAPKNYQWVINLLGFSGTIEQGLSELNELLEATYKKKELRYLRDETIVLLTFMEMNMVRNKGSAVIRSRLNSVENIHEKPLLQFAKSVFHFANAENDSIVKLLSGRAVKPDHFNLNYLDYMEGIARLNKLDFTAEKCFRRYVDNHKGSSFINSSYQKIAWIHLLQDDRAGYEKYISMAEERKKGYYATDEDKQAVKESQTKDTPNLHLLRSRLLFDGGYYQRALQEIAGKPPGDFPALRDKLEFTYRLARIFEKTNKTDKAVQYYLQTIENGKNFKFYFAANSALLLGMHYEDSGDMTKAEEYYRLCLSMRDHEYQNSLDQKAKAGISRVTPDK